MTPTWSAAGRRPRSRRRPARRWPTTDGYLRDAALAFRPWDVDVSAVRCPTFLWYGGADERALPGADWFAARIPHAEVVVRPGVTHWATLAAYWPEVLGTLAAHPLTPSRTSAESRASCYAPECIESAAICTRVGVQHAPTSDGLDHFVILVTRPAPTVRPPSRMANRRPSSMAIGWMSSTAISVLSPGMTISVPSGRVTTPVTSVVRK